ncbi:hypothetical protein LCGC14_2753170 [marine sediment metagenome]|uniref:Uncharacterized protein n=1 Tax=marine sediment metagenome TaxID=412755 RepID=A0A0F9B9T0_9ZZZZ
MPVPRRPLAETFLVGLKEDDVTDFLGWLKDFLILVLAIGIVSVVIAAVVWVVWRLVHWLL